MVVFAKYLHLVYRGAAFSIGFGAAVWLLFLNTSFGTAFPAQLAGFVAAIVGMVAGSLAPQVVVNRHGPHHVLAGGAKA